MAISALRKSERLRHSVEEVETLTGHKVVFFNIGRGCGQAAPLVQGYRRSEGVSEPIWLDGYLSRPAREATAAHELAHVVQETLKFPRAVPEAKLRKPASALRLAASINNLVLDVHADRWALSRGFDVEAALAESSLPAVVDVLRQSGWKRARSNTPGEINDRVLAVDYAALKLRTWRFGLFNGLESLWMQRWPRSRLLGRRIATALARTRFSSPESCRGAMKRILKILELPSGRIKIV